MCWNESVSMAFAIVDAIFCLALFHRRRQSDAIYAAFLAAIAAQEWAQYLVWRRGIHTCTAIDICYSLLASSAAQSIPVIAQIAAARSKNKDAAQEVSLRRSIVFWWIQFVITVAAVWYTGNYCVLLGDNHHQVWICASAVYDLGGYLLYLTTVSCYFASGFYGLDTLPVPLREKRMAQFITTANLIVSYSLYFWTLEACSVWCWSAFAFGFYFYFRDGIHFNR